MEVICAWMDQRRLPGMYLSLNSEGPSRFFAFYRLILGDLIHPCGFKDLFLA